MRFLAALALLSLASPALADEAPEVAPRRCLVIEPHASPKVGPAEKEPAPMVAQVVQVQCPNGWTLEQGVCLP